MRWSSGGVDKLIQGAPASRATTATQWIYSLLSCGSSLCFYLWVSVSAMHDGMYCWFRDHGWYTTFSSALWDKTIRLYSEEMFTQNSDIMTKRCIHYIVRSEWFQIQSLYLSVWCHVLVLNVPCKPLMFVQVKYFVNLSYFCFGEFFSHLFLYLLQFKIFLLWNK